MENKYKKFKCKDEVIYRFKGSAGYGDSNLWIYGIFSHYKNGGDVVINGNFYNVGIIDILPYEGNEHLVGSQDEPGEEVRLEDSPDEEVRLEEGEWVIYFDSIKWMEEGKHAALRKFQKINGGGFLENHNLTYVFAIRFSDFDPNDMEETKKHILVVKNGKIVRYKG